MSGLWSQGFTGASTTNGNANVRTYNGSAYVAPSNATDAIGVGKGFAALIFADDNFDGVADAFPKTMSATGTVVTTDVQVTLNQGLDVFTLVGNPYSSTIDTDLLTSTSTNLYGTVYSYSNSAGEFISWNGSIGSLTNGLIAPFQSFWIRRTSASTARRVNTDNTDYGAVAKSVPVGETIDPQPLDKITGSPLTGVNTATGTNVPVKIKPSYRGLCYSTKHYKKEYDLILVKVTDPTMPNLYDMAELVFDDSEFTNEFDLGYDIDKLGVNNGAPMVFTVLDKHALVINKMKSPVDVTTVPLGFVSKENDKTFTIELEQVPAGWRVYIEDKMTGAWQEITNNGYSFKNNLEFRMERFVLHFSMKSNPIAQVHPSVVAWGMSIGIEVAFSNMRSLEAEILITNMMGQVVYNNKNVSTSESFNIPLAQREPQVYIVTITTPELTTTQKVVR